MTTPQQQYKPIGTTAVEMAVASTFLQGDVTAVRVYLRTQTALATPETFITDNGLEQEVVSHAGLLEATAFVAYALVSSTAHGDDYVYVIDATVGTS